MRFGFAMAAGLIALAFPAMASDISGLKKRVLGGLEGPSQARDISNGVIGATALAAEGLDSLAGRDLRARYWLILPGGVVPIHEHAQRPATIFTLQGKILEYRNDQDAPVQHEAGALSLEEGADLSHWWINNGDEGVRLIAFDVVVTDKDAIGQSAADTPAPVDLDLPAADGAQWTLEGNVDLGAHFQGAYGQGLSLSHYRVVIEPGGTAPLDIAAGEPAIYFIETGSVSETSADGTRTLGAEEGAVVAQGQSVWWENTGTAPAELHIGIVEPLAKASAEQHSG